ncbi:hypothetical protein FHU23_002549 [Clostridium saccharobutylicum]|uniref:Uncharacterized protein n=1 Tax=Clostridium saccharobutylicum DSM 13864 TaxID=1345695 RepID=U5MTL0_CLOSA|nr:hypothetical protein CLSA_c31630 [Clostridium saccharobutylicum DSM 13864]MBA2905819.1 hypothetical protein [Clostridium saccharobutylicum]MBA8790442.1 hypothetical protein [Clostridium saccharobutylicum]MBA8897092.1 hypothetical protein [Clostridium saccharobutylicum]MBA8983500.1 hypothetical protein [Clostridium saccharobutylicum]
MFIWIKQQQSIILSSYSGIYDIVVPKDNLLRKINELKSIVNKTMKSGFKIDTIIGEAAYFEKGNI